MHPRAHRPPVGQVAARAHNPTTRRGTPWQDRSPIDLSPTAPAVTAAHSQGQPPAQPRPAISTREQQSGRAPTRPAPTRRGHPARPPPTNQPIRHNPCPAAQSCAPGPARQGRLRRRYASASAPLDPPTRARFKQRSGQGPHRAAHHPVQPTTTNGTHHRNAILTLDKAVPHQANVNHSTASVEVAHDSRRASSSSTIDSSSLRNTGVGGWSGRPASIGTGSQRAPTP